MANAQFEQHNTGSVPGGFSAGSYRAAKAEAAPQRSLTPAQQKLAGLENALPKALRTRAVAGLLCAVMAVGSVAGIGGAKLAAQSRDVVNSYTTGIAEDVKYNEELTVAKQLTARENAAANILTSAGNVLGTNGAEYTAAKAALEAFQQSRAEGFAPARQYAANEALGAAVDMLYNAMKLQAPESEKMGTVQNQYSAFNQAQRMLGSLGYNAAAQAYNRTAEGFPAGLIAVLWGIGEVELFA